MAANDGGEISVELTLDSIAGNEREVIDAVTEVFPRQFRPSVSARMLFHDAAQVAPLITLTIRGVGICISAWIGKLVFGPSLEEVGSWLRDVLKIYLSHFGRTPKAPRLLLCGQIPYLEILIRSDALLTSMDIHKAFPRLIVDVVREAEKGVFDEAEKVTVSWDDENEKWRFETIRPKEIWKKRKYLQYDAATGEWHEKPLE